MLSSLQYLGLILLPLLYFTFLDITGRGSMKVKYLIPLITYSFTTLIIFGFPIHNLFTPLMNLNDFTLLFMTCIIALVFGFIPSIGSADKALFISLLLFAPVYIVLGIVTIATFINLIFKHEKLRIEKNKSIFAPYLLIGYISLAVLMIVMRL